jgi:acyl dehydratase
MSPLEPGQELRPLVIESVDPGAMKTMAVLLRDPNPIHWDTTVVAGLGLGTQPINQGPINMSYLVELAVQAAGGIAGVRRFGVRFLANVVAGDRVVCTGRVVSCDDQAGTAELELTAAVGERPVLAGTATVALRPAAAGDAHDPSFGTEESERHEGQR